MHHVDRFLPLVAGNSTRLFPLMVLQLAVILLVSSFRNMVVDVGLRSKERVAIEAL